MINFFSECLENITNMNRNFAFPIRSDLLCPRPIGPTIKPEPISLENH